VEIDKEKIMVIIKRVPGYPFKILTGTRAASKKNWQPY